jgi:type II secretory pathway predicted ATPase ExeA
VCRKVTAALHSGLYRVFYVPLSTGNVLDMYKCIAWELGLPTERNRASASKAIRDEVTRLVTEAKQQPVLVVDEAHHLATTSSRICVCSPTTTRTPRTACACSWSGSPSCGDDCP